MHVKPIQHPSPNHDSRGGQAVDMLVLHYTGMPTAHAALERLCDPAVDKRVSAHYLVDEQGSIFQLVPESERAWHAGVSSWQGEKNLNARSIGIEIANPGHDGGLPPFPPAQMAAVTALCKDIMSRHAIPAWNVVAHSDIAPSRKQDPGERFDWKGLAEQGIGFWPREAEPGLFHDPFGWVMSLLGRQEMPLALGSAGPKVLTLQQKLKRFGYDVPLCSTYGKDTKCVVEAFQRHYRPTQVDGIWDTDCARRLTNLLNRLPSVNVPPPDGRMAASL